LRDGLVLLRRCNTFVDSDSVEVAELNELLAWESVELEADTRESIELEADTRDSVEFELDVRGFRTPLPVLLVSVMLAADSWCFRGTSEACSWPGFRSSPTDIVAAIVDLVSWNY
jgi:hypothetical protein